MMRPACWVGFWPPVVAGAGAGTAVDLQEIKSMPAIAVA